MHTVNNGMKRFFDAIRRNGNIHKVILFCYLIGTARFKHSKLQVLRGFLLLFYSGNSISWDQLVMQVHDHCWLLKELLQVTQSWCMDCLTHDRSFHPCCTNVHSMLAWMSLLISMLQVGGVTNSLMVVGPDYCCPQKFIMVCHQLARSGDAKMNAYLLATTNESTWVTRELKDYTRKQILKYSQCKCVMRKLLESATG